MRLLAPAKINLFLQVTGKRPDGYHDLVTIMSCIGLYDTITLSFDTREIRVICDDPGIPEDESNLAHRAASLFIGSLREPPGNKAKGVKIFIDKQIPIGAGLGGGSSDAAAVFLGLNRYYGHPFSRSEVMRIGFEVGADVPFFIFGKPALVQGAGEKLEPFKGLKPYRVLLVYPGFSVSTAEVYGKFNFGLTKSEKQHKNNPFIKQDFDAESHFRNDLEQVTAAEYPDILIIKKTLLAHGATAALMSGSGPTVFGLFLDPDEARQAKNLLSRHSKWKLFLADLLV
ncbi:MAG TPA: 4-(cytidine 5'-diphospho)-2-C-methyl-D-erythritol kinase [Desulfobacterales bacterium]|nr:4-(cytidine 5'-diphospho)-2-C-methyl-D-erythritol kinase [Desulfobacterales bacterium]